MSSRGFFSTFNFFKVGTPINEVKNMAKTAKVSKEIKSLIFDFCNKDLDKQITDDIEIRILKTWFSGDKRLKCPIFRMSNGKK